MTTTTHTEPFHVSKAIATLDYISQGRAGLQARISATALEAACSSAVRVHGRSADSTGTTASRRPPAPSSMKRPVTLWDVRAPASGTAGRIDARNLRHPHRPLHRPRQAALHQFRRTTLLGQGSLHHTPAAPGPTRWSRSWPVCLLAFELAARRYSATWCSPTPTLNRTTPVLDRRHWCASTEAQVGRHGKAHR